VLIAPAPAERHPGEKDSGADWSWSRSSRGSRSRLHFYRPLSRGQAGQSGMMDKHS